MQSTRDQGRGASNRWCDARHGLISIHSMFSVCWQSPVARSEGAGDAGGVPLSAQSAACARAPRTLHRCTVRPRRSSRLPCPNNQPHIIPRLTPKSVYKDYKWSELAHYLQFTATIGWTITALFTSRAPALPSKLCMSCAACAFRNAPDSIRAFVYLRS